MSNPVNATVPIISSPLGTLPSGTTSSNTSTSRPSTSSSLPTQSSTNTSTTPTGSSGTTGTTSGTTTGNTSGTTTGNTSGTTTGNTSGTTTGNTSGTTGSNSSGTTGSNSSGTTGSSSGNSSGNNSSGTITNGSSTNDSSTPTIPSTPASSPTPAPNASANLAPTTTIVRTITQGSGPQASIVVVTSTYAPQQTPGTHNPTDGGGGGGSPNVIAIAVPCAIGAIALLVALVLVVRWMRARSSAARAAEEIKWPEVVNSDGDRAALYPEPTRPAAGHGLGDEDEETTAAGAARGVGPAAGLGAGEMINMAGTGAGGLGQKHSLSPANTLSATYVGSQDHGYPYPAAFLAQQPPATYGGYYSAASPPHGYPVPAEDHLQPGYPPMARREPGYPAHEYYQQEYDDKSGDGHHKEMHSPPEPGYGAYPAQLHHRQQSGDQYNSQSHSHSAEHYQQQPNHGNHSGPSSPVEEDYFNSGHGNGPPRRLVAINPDEPS